VAPVGRVRALLQTGGYLLWWTGGPHRPDGTGDGAQTTLAGVNEAETAGQVLAATRELRPQALLTWPPDGLSGHPDHAAVSRWTARAFQQAAALGSDAPAALYYLAVPRSVAQALGLVQLYAIPDEEVTLAVDVADAWAQKMAAIRWHRTQLGESPVLQSPEERWQMFLGREHFRRAEVRQGDDFLLAPEED
jgi:LmbE family N-acetylglucosaminyl deacetylase